jgi:Na+/proline symporter
MTFIIIIIIIIIIVVVVVVVVVVVDLYDLPVECSQLGRQLCTQPHQCFCLTNCFDDLYQCVTRF